MTRVADGAGLRGKARLAAGIALFLAVLLFPNYGVSKLADMLAIQMWPSDVDSAVYLVFSSAGLYNVLMALPFMPEMGVGIAITPVPLLFLLRAM